MIALHPDATWEDVVSECQRMAFDIDKHRWDLGDVAHYVASHSRYGDDAMDDLANQCGVRQRTMQTYRKVASTFDGELRRHLHNLENLAWSHYELASRVARKTGDVETAVEFLENCSMNDWTIQQAEKSYKERYSAQPETVTYRCIGRVVYDGSAVIIEITGGDELPDGIDVKLTIKEGTDNA
jgi:hypothetical protein